MSSFPRITLITPVYNAGTTLERTLKSIIAQDYPNLETIIMDSCSTDHTPQIMEQYKDYITRWVCEKDRGPPDAQNKAVALATGDFIQFVYGDDEIMPGLLHKVAAIARANPEVRVITCGSLMINDGNGRPFEQARYVRPHQLAITMENALNGHVHSQFFHKSVFEQFGKLKTHVGTDFCFSNDREFLTRLVLAGVETAVIPEPLYVFHIHSASLTGGGGNLEKVLKQLRDLALSLTETPGISTENRNAARKAIIKNETGLALLYLSQHKLRPALAALKAALAISLFDTAFYTGDYVCRHLVRFIKRKWQ